MSRKIRIQMVVSEVNDDGTPGKFVVFDESLDESMGRDWFSRMGDGIKNVFNLDSHCIVRITTPRIVNKICAIKAYRCVSGCGLREAKDAVEQANGAIWCETHRLAETVKRYFEREAAVTCDITPSGPHSGEHLRKFIFAANPGEVERNVDLHF